MRIPIRVAQVASLATGIAICVTLWQHPLRAQTPGAANDAGSVAGRVVDPAGDPISGAVVTLSFLPTEPVLEALSVTARTGEDGRYSFPRLPAGRYLIGSVDHRNYASQRILGTLSVANGREVAGMDFVLEPKVVLSGRLFDVDGSPKEGIPVVAFHVSYPQGRRELEVAESNVTDDRGVFRLSDLGPGRYYLAADRFPPNTWAGALRGVELIPPDPVETLNVTTFYPNAADLSRAEPLDLAAGDEILDADFTMRREPAYSIQGIVMDGETGMPVEGAQIVRLPSDGQLSAEIGQPRTVTDASGAWRMNNVPSGGLTLAAYTGRVQFASRDWTYSLMAAIGLTAKGGQVSIHVASDVSGVRLVVDPGTDLHGQVRIDDGTEEGGEVTIPLGSQGPFGLNRGLTISLHPVAGFAVNQSGAEFQADGSFAIPGVKPGDYVAEIQGLREGSDLYVKSVRLGNDAASVPLHISDASQPLNIDLAYGAAVLRVQVRDGNGNAVPGAKVSLWRVHPEAALMNGNRRYEMTDQNGLGEFTGLAPAEYYAIAWEELPDPGLGLYPKFLRLFEGAATKVDLSSASIQDLELDVISMNEVASAFANLP